MPTIQDTLFEINPNLRQSSILTYYSALQTIFTVYKKTFAWNPDEFEALNWLEDHEGVIAAIRELFTQEDIAIDTIRCYYNTLNLFCKRNPDWITRPESIAYVAERKTLRAHQKKENYGDKPLPYELDDIIDVLEKRVILLFEKYPLTLMEEDAFMEFLLMKIFKYFPHNRTRYAGMTVCSIQNWDSASSSLVIDKEKLSFNNEEIPDDLAQDLIIFLKKLGGRKYLFLQNYVRLDRTRKPLTAFNITKITKRIFHEHRTVDSVF